MTASPHNDLERAINDLASFRHGDIGVVEAVACGDEAIPTLRALLLQRERSGLYQVRCRAVEALAALRAYSVLYEFLSSDRLTADPVERMGDDAVVNAAARAMAEIRDERVFRLMLRLAERPSLTGVIAALGGFRRAEAVPFLIDALADDASRPTAEAALKRLGRTVRPALAASANLRLPSAGHESVSSLRRRRSALKLLHDVAVPRKLWPQLRGLMRDRDAKVCVLACKICLAAAPPTARHDAVARLVSLLADADWMLRDEIEGCLRSATAT